MKKLIMIMILGLVLTSCGDEVITQPSVNAGDLAMLYTTADTIQVAVVTEDKQITYYDISNPIRPVPEVRVLLDTPIKLVVVLFFFILGWGMGYAWGKND